MPKTLLTHFGRASPVSTNKFVNISGLCRLAVFADQLLIKPSQSNETWHVEVRVEHWQVFSETTSFEDGCLTLYPGTKKGGSR